MNIHSLEMPAPAGTASATEYWIQTMTAVATVLASDRRSSEILESIRRIFAEKGFDGASMQDLARAADMSVGNFYRYFPSKAAIIDAMISRDLDEIEQNFAVIIDSYDPLAQLRATIKHRVSTEVCADEGPMMAEITAVALRKPEIGEVMLRMEQVITQHLMIVFARISGLSLEVATQRFTAHAGLIMILIKGCAMSPRKGGATESDLVAVVLRTIDGVLAEVSGAQVEGKS
jgi:AcrR family transcriptional regulator